MAQFATHRVAFDANAGGDFQIADADRVLGVAGNRGRLVLVQRGFGEVVGAELVAAIAFAQDFADVAEGFEIIEKRTGALHTESDAMADVAGLETDRHPRFRAVQVVEPRPADLHAAFAGNEFVGRVLVVEGGQGIDVDLVRVDGEARAVGAGGVDPRRHRDVIAVPLMLQIELREVHRDGVELLPEAAELAARRQRVFLRREIRFVVVRAFAQISAAELDRMLLVDLVLDLAVEIVVLGLFDIESAVGVGTGVGKRDAEVADRAGVRDVALIVVVIAVADFEFGGRLFGRRNRAEIDDAVVVQRPIDDVTGAEQHFDILQTLEWRRVVGGRVDVRRGIDRHAVFQQQHFAAAPRRRTAQADAGAAA